MLDQKIESTKPNSGTTNFESNFSETFRGTIIIAPDTEVIFKNLKNASKLILGARSSAEVTDLNKVFKNDEDIEVMLSGDEISSDNESI
ncbi:hypothetical protein A3306_06255 [Rickettsia bellii]|uniref:Uncharacterized protein n=3 Tax=Rickettsia bellii TaxID=33990 RepID=Q1RIH9_RICBR|nr:hypothetical protein [Rickettsia bellii]ABE04835.1 unknown [Rickettsia bellii RML369-C]ABV79313.1 hypothetical protein A1I_04880 [Rickettsia bellii OSU 85-389]ARD86733.1 hypothetical protein A3306_06255 [Rickettsia bellii]KJV89582.1 hypothetical protein RBEAN4_0561 [Rickettsia bellii str. RML An4]KJV92021.1 hypothetical protein RBEMOGI_0639 [Rickettsia bellii str. RML Mogi]